MARRYTTAELAAARNVCRATIAMRGLLAQGPPVWHPWPAQRPVWRLLRRAALLAPLALALALALWWVPGTGAYGDSGGQGPAATCGSDADCCATQGPAGPLCGAPVPACPAGTARDWAGGCTALGTGPAAPGPGGGCWEDMPCWCAAHGLPLGQCTTADTLPAAVAPVAPPVSAAPPQAG